MSAENVHAIVEFGSSYEGVETFEVTPLSGLPPVSRTVCLAH